TAALVRPKRSASWRAVIGPWAEIALTRRSRVGCGTAGSSSCTVILTPSALVDSLILQQMACQIRGTRCAAQHEGAPYLRRSVTFGGRRPGVLPLALTFNYPGTISSVVRRKD